MAGWLTSSSTGETSFKAVYLARYAGSLSGTTDPFSSQVCHLAQVGEVGVETVTGEQTDKNTFCGKGVAVSVTWLVPTTRYEISWGHHAPAMLALLALLFPRS